MLIYKYILKSHAGPFVFSLMTLIFLFLFQFLMKSIDQLIGKGLSLWVIVQLITLNLAWMLTGHRTERLPWNASFLVEFIEGESMLLFLDQKGISVSSGSACTSRALKGSHVLTACDVPPEQASGSVLFSLGLENTPEDIDYVLESLPPIVDRLRQMSPLYAKFLKEGGG